MAKRKNGSVFLMAGVGLFAIAALLLIGAQYSLRFRTGIEAMGLFLLGGACLAACFPVIRQGLRREQPSVDQVLAEDPRAPVLYLRSFADDGTRQTQAPIKLGAQVFVPDPRAEDMLAPLLNCLGPLVAIGRPGEKLPETGAYRMYVSDDVWQETVLDFMARAQLVVILGRTVTGGVQWEVKTALAKLSPDKLVFFFPSHGAARERLYQAFRSDMAAEFDTPLPETLGNASFLRFGPDWVAEPVHADAALPARAHQESLVRMIQGIQPDFVEPPFWKTVSKGRLYLFFGVMAVTVLLVLAIIAFGVSQILAV